MVIGGERAGEEAAVCSSVRSAGLRDGRLTAGDKDLDEQGVSLTVWISALDPGSVNLCSFLCSVLLRGVLKISFSLSLSLSITLLRFVLCSAVDEWSTECELFSRTSLIRIFLRTLVISFSSPVLLSLTSLSSFFSFVLCSVCDVVDGVGCERFSCSSLSGAFLRTPVLKAVAGALLLPRLSRCSLANGTCCFRLLWLSLSPREDAACGGEAWEGFKILPCTGMKSRRSRFRFLLLASHLSSVAMAVHRLPANFQPRPRSLGHAHNKNGKCGTYTSAAAELLRSGGRQELAGGFCRRL